MAAKLPDKSLVMYLVPIINPLYRLTASSLNAVDAADQSKVALRSLSQEVLDLISQRVGTASYLQAYNFVREQVTAVRRDRKRARAVHAAVSPAAAAASKMALNLKKRHKRKEKLHQQALRGSSGTGGIGGQKKRRTDIHVPSVDN
jgi:hypothetical protein